MSEYHRTPPDLDRQREQHRHSHVQLCVLDHDHAGLRLPVVCAGMYMHLLRIRKACLCEQPVSPSFCRTCVHDAHKPYLRILRICVQVHTRCRRPSARCAKKKRKTCEFPGPATYDSDNDGLTHFNSNSHLLVAPRFFLDHPQRKRNKCVQ